MHFSRQNWNSFDCKLTGQEQEMVNCDERSSAFALSGDEVTFFAPQRFSAVYVPFTHDRIKLRINPETDASYAFWVLYDTFGWSELQEVMGEVIDDVSPQALKKTLAWKKNNNFFFEKDEEGGKTITIDKHQPFMLKSTFMIQNTITFPNFLRDTWIEQ